MNDPVFPLANQTAITTTQAQRLRRGGGAWRAGCAAGLRGAASVTRAAAPEQFSESPFIMGVNTLRSVWRCGAKVNSHEHSPFFLIHLSPLRGARSALCPLGPRLHGRRGTLAGHSALATSQAQIEAQVAARVRLDVSRRSQLSTAHPIEVLCLQPCPRNRERLSADFR